MWRWVGNSGRSVVSKDGRHVTRGPQSNWQWAAIPFPILTTGHRYSLTIKVHAFTGNGIIGIFAVPPPGEPKYTPHPKHVFMTHHSVAWNYAGELYIDNISKEYNAQTDRWAAPVPGPWRGNDNLNWAHFPGQYDDEEGEEGEEGEDGGDVEYSAPEPPEPPESTTYSTTTPTVRLDLELLSPSLYEETQDDRPIIIGTLDLQVNGKRTPHIGHVYQQQQQQQQQQQWRWAIAMGMTPSHYEILEATCEPL
eukprot:TRINITY_DN4462_c0_g1_i1.p1 TRINITY_DN4462_c0_g1~~TRINITY_DN4462_c0_g1_i1.p1  ORF type:complete len:251 (-),score=46.49 TRINITY_DN4462_c0_g1_i1:36-788(-)